MCCGLYLLQQVHNKPIMLFRQIIRKHLIPIPFYETVPHSPT